jgi:diadenosine tetraphosphate (Ap4A) HIT family hydrolase
VSEVSGEGRRLTEAADCLLCRPADADRFFGRTRVWTDGRWRLSVVERGAVVGFAHLEPVRHIAHVTDLTGAEADTFGAVLARVTTALRDATGADLVYAYVFGERVPHFHVNLAPHRDGDALQGGPAMLRSGAVDVPAAEHRAAIAAIGDRLTDRPRPL